MRTRDTGDPIASVASTVTPAIGPFGSSFAILATGSAPTLRKSITTVSGSGRVAMYGTGSLASMTNDALRALTRDVIAVSRAPDIFDAPAAAYDNTPQPAANANSKNTATP